jgi:ABC-type multidrug transport system fused ATPase/permease subunit
MKKQANELNQPLSGEYNLIQSLNEPNEQEEIKLSPYYKSNIFGKFFFNWTRYAMDTANKAPLKIVDFKGLAEKDQSHNLLKPLYEKWYSKKKENSNLFLDENAFFKSIIKSYYLWIIALTFLNICIDSLKYLQIYFYDSIIQYFEFYHSPEKYAPPFLPIYINALGLILIKISKTFFHHQVKFTCSILGVKAANAVTALIYDKVTKTSIFIKSQISEGEILNFIQVDSEKLNFLFTSLPKILTVPFNLIISFYALFIFFGKSFIFGLTILILMILIIWYIQYKYLSNTKEMLKKKDKRMRLTTHTFHIIKILKLFGWEDEFKDNIDQKRNDELINVKNILYLTALRTFVNSNLSLLTSLASIGGYTYFFGAMEIKTLFSSTKLVKEVAVPLIDIPQFITDLNSLLISLKRIQNFLLVKDIDNKNNEKEKRNELNDIINNDNNDMINIGDNSAINFNNCDFGIKGEEIIKKDEYMKTGDKVLLKNLNFSVNKGELITIIGETGCGKTCLINAILNNLELLNENSPDKNRYIYSKNISYACQDPWIMNGTIRDNILFYNEFDSERYYQVVNACQLDKDFENLKHGDLTEIGSTGNNISGGQRARIALARAIYKDADIYLFDDPISSVDTYISMKIFHQGIVKLLKNKTVIYVTHDTRNLKYSNKVVVMNRFEIEFEGNFEKFCDNEKYKDIIDKAHNNKNENKINKDITEIKGEYFSNKDDSFGRLLRDEDQVHGKVSWRLYDLFFRIQGGYCLFLILIMLTLSIVVINAYGKEFVSSWSNKAKNQDDLVKENNYKFFMQYSTILFIGIVIQFIKEMLVAFSNFKSTKYLHEKMIFSLIHAPINLFFDVVPIGQILNRLIHDLDLSQEIIWMFNKILKSLIGLFTSIYICFMENRESIYASPIIALLAYLLLKYFITAGRDLNRLNGISRSPVISLFSETILGITTIRTFKKENPSKKKFYEKLNDHFGVMLYKYGTDNWFCMSLDLISHFYLGFVLGGAIFNIDSFDAKTVGIMLDYSSDFSEELLEVFEQGTHVEKSLISLERCDAYTKIQSENYEDEKIEKNKIYSLEDKSWPNEGKVIYENYSMKYRPNCDLALKNINININSGEKIGIVGRTGSGKSSLTLSLFRIVEAFKGKITIDGKNIAEIPLKKLRRAISIVPQEPFLLEGTLKTNLDPLNLYNEQEINEVLDKVKLYQMMENDNMGRNVLKGINTEIKEYGNNLSFGCRQLLCVARAILRKSKVIILDEATSSVDQKTEDIISTAVDTMFKDSTVITIAHRINTVKKCQRIIVMNAGEIVEVGKPDDLIKDNKSKFYSLYYKYIEETD